MGESITIRVVGMSCDHCVAAVREELQGVQGVRRVEVDLATGTATVEGEGIDETALAAAVVDAGYETG